MHDYTCISCGYTIAVLPASSWPQHCPSCGAPVWTGASSASFIATGGYLQSLESQLATVQEHSRQQAETIRLLSEQHDAVLKVIETERDDADVKRAIAEAERDTLSAEVVDLHEKLYLQSNSRAEAAEAERDTLKASSIAHDILKMEVEGLKIARRNDEEILLDTIKERDTARARIAALKAENARLRALAAPVGWTGTEPEEEPPT